MKIYRKFQRLTVRLEFRNWTEVYVRDFIGSEGESLMPRSSSGKADERMTYKKILDLKKKRNKRHFFRHELRGQRQREREFYFVL